MVDMQEVLVNNFFLLCMVETEEIPRKVHPQW